MDKVVFSVSKVDKNNYILENMADNTAYKFKEFSDIIDVFSGTNEPKFSGLEPGNVTNTPQEKINIHKRIITNQKQGKSKYFWSRSYNKFDQFEKISVMKVLLHVKKNMKGW